MAVGTMDFDALHTSSDSDGKRFIALGSLRLPLTSENVAYARRFTRMVVELSSVSVGALDDAELLVSELFTNVVVHVDQEAAEFGALVALARRGNMLRLEVHDAGEPMAQPEEPDAAAEGGRGLWIVGALAERWGVDETPGGKCVWAEIEAWSEASGSTEA